MKQKKSSEKFFSAGNAENSRIKLILAIIFLIALISRVYFLKRFIEYDEIWSLLNYSVLNVGQIFSDFSLPNNHPVNTLLIKLLYFSRENAWTIRLGSLAFSLASVWLLYDIGRRTAGKKSACYAALAGAVMPPLVIAGTTARGYAGQFFFLLLFADMLIRCRRGRMLPTVCAAASGIAAIISLPSSILYIAPAGLWFVINRIIKKEFYKFHLICFGFAVLFTAIWYGSHFQDFTQSQSFKYPVDDLNTLLCWLKEYFDMSAIPFFLIPAALWLKRKNKMSWILFSVILFPLAAALITSPAPGRVYLPSAIAGILLFSPSRKTVKYNYIFPAIFLICQIAVSLKTLPGTALLSDMAAFSDINGTVVIYPPNDGYPVRWNYPESCEKFHRQLSFASTLERSALAVTGSNVISGTNAAGGAIEWKLPFPAKGSAPYIINLQKTAELETNEIGVLLIPPLKAEDFQMILANFKNCEIMPLNPWLTMPLFDSRKNTYKYAALAVRPKEKLSVPARFPLFKIVH